MEWDLNKTRIKSLKLFPWKKKLKMRSPAYLNVASVLWLWQSRWLPHLVCTTFAKNVLKVGWSKAMLSSAQCASKILRSLRRIQLLLTSLTQSKRGNEELSRLVLAPKICKLNEWKLTFKHIPNNLS